MRDIAAHGLKGRKIALIENGSWAPTAAKQMRNILAPLEGVEFIDGDITVRSSFDYSSECELDALVSKLNKSIAFK